MTEYVLVLTTSPGDGADTLARALVEARLAACVNVLAPMQSVYRWKGKVESAEERQLVIKTTAANVAALELRIQELHPYDVPEFLVVAIDSGSHAYLSWLADSCSIGRAGGPPTTTPAPGRPADPRRLRSRPRSGSGRR